LRVWGVENPVRELSEITGSPSGGLESGVRSNGSGSSSIGRAGKIFLITIITKSLELNFNHFSLD
jgi:hypothetical protein